MKFHQFFELNLAYVAKKLAYK